ncbi:MAG TPA: GntR family transcriptional regulator [Vineibacter sp.]|nr:GntR family transcriptional regulator [Vineibacter sp.]
MVIGKLRRVGPPVLVRERALHQLRDAIISGEIAPGARLIERELCAAMGVSRASVREVIRRLEAEQLIDVVPRRGPTVTTLTSKQAAEIYEVRGIFEALLIRRFTEMASERDIAALQAIFEDVKRVAAKRDVVQIINLMRRFNEHLMAVVRHDIARDILSQLHARINWLRVKAMAQPGRLAASIGEVTAILDAVARRDAAAAAEHMAAYIRNARDAALEQLAEQGDNRVERQGRKRGGKGS